MVMLWFLPVVDEAGAPFRVLLAEAELRGRDEFEFLAVEEFDEWRLRVDRLDFGVFAFEVFRVDDCRAFDVEGQLDLAFRAAGAFAGALRGEVVLLEVGVEWEERDAQAEEFVVQHAAVFLEFDVLDCHDGDFVHHDAAQGVGLGKGRSSSSKDEFVSFPCEFRDFHGCCLCL